MPSSDRYRDGARSVGEMKSRSPAPRQQADDQPDTELGEEALQKAASLERGLDGRISIALGEGAERREESGTAGREVGQGVRTQQETHSPSRGEGTVSSNFSDNTTRYALFHTCTCTST